MTGSWSGTDRHHYQVGFGTQLSLPSAVSLFFEWAPFGERALAAGVSLAL